MAAVRTLKGVIEDQQTELQHLKQQNAALTDVKKRTEKGPLQIQVLGDDGSTRFQQSMRHLPFFLGDFTEVAAGTTDIESSHRGGTPSWARHSPRQEKQWQDSKGKN